MTKVFDDEARSRWEGMISFDDFHYDNTPVCNMIVKQVSPKAVRPLIAKYHYTKTFPDSTLFCYVGYLNGSIAGVITFGMGVGKNQYTALIPTIKDGEYCELTRLWSPDTMPKNTESKLISTAIKMLPSKIKLIVSFADPSKGHYGCIYQSTNFIYCGMSGGGKMLVTNDGIEKHPRLLGIYRMRHPEYRDLTTPELMDLLGYKYVSGSGKYRYILFKGSKKDKAQMISYIRHRIEPYPKKTTLKQTA